MSKGIVLIAHNNGKDDYYKMAVSVAIRAEKYLNLPTTLITDTKTATPGIGCFHNVIYVEPETTNWRKQQPWINKGRHRVFELTPYSDTLVLDTDYMINSRLLLEAFKLPGDFCIHRGVTWLYTGAPTEFLAPGIPTHWATVLRFKKTTRTEAIFSCVEMVQENYGHYANIYGFQDAPFRNDYAFTIALKIINGHLPCKEDYFHWNLVHVPLELTVKRNGPTSYTCTSTDTATGRAGYIKVTDFDFHMLSKKNFLELVDE